MICIELDERDVRAIIEALHIKVTQIDDYIKEDEDDIRMLNNWREEVIKLIEMLNAAVEDK